MAFVVGRDVHGAHLLAHGHDSTLRINARNADEPFRIGVGKRDEKDSIHKAKDGGVCADAEGESEDGDSGEGGRFAEHAKGEAKVLEKRVEKRKAAGFAVLLFGLLRAAETDVSLPARFGGGEAAAEIFLYGELQVCGHFGVEVAVELSAAKEGPQPVKGLAEPGNHMWLSPEGLGRDSSTSQADAFALLRGQAGANAEEKVGLLCSE